MKKVYPGQLGMSSQPTFTTRVNLARRVSSLGLTFSYIICSHVNMSQVKWPNSAFQHNPDQPASYKGFFFQIPYMRTNYIFIVINKTSSSNS